MGLIYSLSAQTDRQTNKQTDRQTDRKPDNRQKVRQVDRQQTERQTDCMLARQHPNNKKKYIHHECIYMYSVLRNSEDFANRISGGVGGGCFSLLFYFSILPHFYLFYSYTLFIPLTNFTPSTCAYPSLVPTIIPLLLLSYSLLLRRCIFEAMYF